MPIIIAISGLPVFLRAGALVSIGAAKLDYVSLVGRSYYVFFSILFVASGGPNNASAAGVHAPPGPALAVYWTERP